MKEINGTVTLAYVEEDNKQRVIFRVIPLCTREGGVFLGGTEDFPDEGSLRVVPDKREQSTFKERMREIGGLCAINLASDGKELIKVRQNRNYAPDQGEKNKLAIYSDVICEFNEDGCFEVLDMGADAAGALTEKVILHKDKVLYGPVARQEAVNASVESLHPFGNDHFLLCSIGTPSLGKRQVYWNPEALMTWRQRRNVIRHKEKVANTEEKKTSENTAAAPSAASVKESKERKDAETALAAPKKASLPAVVEQPSKESQSSVKHLEKTEKTEKAEKTPAVGRTDEKPAPERSRVAKNRSAAEARSAEKASPIEKPAPAEKAAPMAKTAPAEKTIPSEKPIQREIAPAQQADVAVPAIQPAAETPAPLPIGTKLTILDTELSFDQQISRLDQTVSDGANRLSMDVIPEEEPEEEVTAHFSGTPLIPSSKPITRSVARPESVHHVVEQILVRRDDEEDVGYQIVQNPIDTLRSCLDYIWQNADMRAQAMDALNENETFMRDMLHYFRRQGQNTQAIAAAQEQLAEIEAERLNLLMQLDAAAANEKKYREGAVASLSQKLRAESDRLQKQIAQLEATKKKLNATLDTVSASASGKVMDFLANNVQCLSGAAENRLLLSPVTGQHYTAQEMAEKIRVHLSECGYGISDDDAMDLLLYFSLNDRLCFNARTEADASNFAKVLLESLGLQSVTGCILPESYVEVVSLLPENGQRTPTVTIQSLGTESMSIYGHKTLFLMRSGDLSSIPPELLYNCPILDVPPLSKRSFARTEEWEAVKPASLSSFTDIRALAKPMLEEADAWFYGLQKKLQETELLLPQVTLADMRRFIETAGNHVRGGFLAAADSAVCHWVLPAFLWKMNDPQKLAPALGGLPKALQMLRIPD